MIAKLIKFPTSNSTVKFPFIFSSTRCIGDECCNVQFSDVTSLYFVRQKLFYKKGYTKFIVCIK